LAETRYRARFYLNPNSYAVTGSDKTHAILVGRNISGTGVFTVQLRYTGSVHQIGAQLVNDATGITSTNWYTISVSKHPIEIDWKAATGAGANNGYLSLWLDGVLQETKSGIDNDTRRVDEVRFGPSSGIDSGSSGTVYYDTFESRRSTYIGPAGVMAAFNANPVSGTAPLTVTFTNASQPSDAITAYLWKFGDGYTSTITNPVYSYLPGYYTVTLTAWNGVYSDTITKTRLITATVKANFTASPVTGTAPLTVTFTNTSQPVNGITSYLWNFGDGVTSTITNPVKTYAPGYYTVTLTAWSGSLKDVITRTRLITASVKADFTGSPTSGRAPLAVTFNNASQPANGISSYLWKFGNGATSTLTNPVQTYASVGVYSVTLTANTSSGMKDTLTRTRYITITPGLGDPTALAEDPFANEGQPSIAYNPVAAEYLVAWRSWNSQGDIYARRVLSDGTPSGNAIAVIVKSGEQLDPQAAYGAGMYLVIWRDSSDTSVRGQLLQAGGALSGTEFVIGSGPSNNDMPAIDFNPATGEFLAAWTNNASGDHVRVQRIAPSGGLIGSPIVVSDYNGNYHPAVTHDAAGNYLVVYVCPDSSYFGVCARRLSGTGALLGAAFSVYDGSQTSNVPAAAYNAQSADYLVAWRESRASGADDIMVRRISSAGVALSSAASLQAQTADPYGPAIADRGNGSYVIAWPDNRSGNWDVYGYAIDSDGTPLGAVFPIETTNADQVEAAIGPLGPNGERLIAYNDNRNGNPDIWVERYDATGANFVAAPRSGIAPSTVIFTDTSTAPQPITSWLWNFGDGVTSTLQHPTHTYSTIGYFSVTLETWAGALHNTIVKPQYLATTPRADFTADPTQGETPLVVTFNNTSQPVEGITGYAWDFGDGLTTTTVSPVHTYTAYGLYTVTLTAFSSGGANTLVQPTAINAWPGRGEPVPIASQWLANEERSAIAYNPAAQAYLAVWDEWTTDYDIRARRILSTGLPGGAALTIFSGSGQQQLARVAYGAGVYLIVWEDNQANAVRGQLLQASGVLSGTDFPIGTGGADNNTPAIDFNPVTQEFLVTWVRDNSGDNDVWAQRISTAGQLLGSAIFVNNSGGQQLQPTVAHDNAGAYLVVYVCPDTGAFGICGQRVSGTGTLQGTGFSIYASTANSVMPDLAYDPQRHEYLVVWRDERTGSDEVDAQRVGDDGALIGSTFPVGTQSDEPYPPAVAYHPAAQAYVVLWNQFSGVSGWNVRSRTVWADGSGMDNPASVVGVDGDQVYPALSKQGAGIDLYVLYTDHAAGYPDLYGQRYVPRMAYFTATPDSGYAPLSVQFYDRSTATPIDTRQWDFGDGGSSTLADPAHVYPQPGEYTTVLTITAAGQTYHTAQTIQVADPDRTVINYTYDGLYRLTKADSTGESTTTFEYAYDPVGNRTTQTATITSTQVTVYQYDEANRLIDRTESTGQAYTYAWSDRGEMLAEYFQGTPIRAFTYNAAGQLSEATVLTLTTRFRYNGDGQRLSLEVVGQDTTTYALDYLKSNRILMETTAQTTTLYLYGHSCLGEWTATDGWKYYLQSTLGQVRQAVDDVGNVIYSWAFNPDGTVLQGVQGPITHLECDAVYDWSTGLIYRLGRYFDPTTGVWLMGTGMVLAQAGAGGKRRSKRRLLLLLLLLACIVSGLGACKTSELPCNYTPSRLGDWAIYVDDETSIPETPWLKNQKWESSDRDRIDDALAVTISHYGGEQGFGSQARVLAEFGISKEKPLQIIRGQSLPAAPMQQIRGYVIVYNEIFPMISVEGGPDPIASTLDHEIAHQWDEAHGYNLSQTMLNEVNWGVAPIDLNGWRERGTLEERLPREEFASAVELYFNPERDLQYNRLWTDNLGEGWALARNIYHNVSIGPDSLRLDPNQLLLPLEDRKPSATGTIKVRDRYDYVKYLFKGTWE
jgi:YD repeat-containing protein